MKNDGPGEGEDTAVSACFTASVLPRKARRISESLDGVPHSGWLGSKQRFCSCMRSVTIFSESPAHGENIIQCDTFMKRRTEKLKPAAANAAFNGFSVCIVARVVHKVEDSSRIVRVVSLATIVVSAMMAPLQCAG